jgi:hypothetical protein
MLNLRQSDGRSGSLHSNAYNTTREHQSTVRFNAGAIIGNMGESLEFGKAPGHDDSLENEVIGNVGVHSGLSASSDTRSTTHHVDTDTEVSRFID